MIIGILTCVASGIMMFISIFYGIAILLTETALSPIGLFIESGIMLSAGITGIVFGSRKSQSPLIASLLLYACAVGFCMIEKFIHGENSFMHLLMYFNAVCLAVRCFQFF